MDRIAVFARWPEPGRVKTRLAPALSPALACDLHRAMLEDALVAALESRADETVLCWADAPSKAGVLEGWAPAGESTPSLRLERCVVRHQQGADLGERLANAFAELLSSAGDRAVIIGADCPMLDGRALSAAFEALAHHDLVLGPAADGGYALIGLTRPAPELFHDVAWGTAQVLEQTRSRARALGLGWTEMPPVEDLDTSEDLVRWIRRAARDDRAARTQTSAALRAMGLLPPG